jgi:CubicO group peptidase (beta-lactamase class C family)
LFRIGSVSKLLTAMTLLRLEQSDRVELDQPIGSYMQTLPMHLQPLTLRHLSGHIAGIRHYRGNEFFTTTGYDRLRDAIAIFANDSLVTQPGTRYAYSSYGYNLIGAVLEEITAQPFPELVRRHVLEPLDMNATAPDMPGAHSASRARLYTVSDSGIATAPLDDLSGRWPAGGYLSSTDDLSRLGRAILADGLLNDEALRTMLTPQRLASGAATPVGVGWRVAQDSTGRRYFHHGGTSNGGAAFLLVYPDQQLVIAMASNAFTSVGERDALRIASIFLKPIP